MTDLEITRLCAEAMGGHLIGTEWIVPRFVAHGTPPEANLYSMPVYDPLHDDAQVMALVKRFHILIGNLSIADRFHFTASVDAVRWHKNLDLNRAICECVAKLQAAK